MTWIFNSAAISCINYSWMLVVVIWQRDKFDSNLCINIFCAILARFTQRWMIYLPEIDQKVNFGVASALWCLASLPDAVTDGFFSSSVVCVSCSFMMGICIVRSSNSTQIPSQQSLNSWLILNHHCYIVTSCHHRSEGVLVRKEWIKRHFNS